MEINEIVKKIQKSKKYKNLNSDLIEDICISLSYKHKEKELLDIVKSKLHQIWGSYYTTRPDFKKLLKKYENNEISNVDILKIHQSTKERVGEYREILEYIFDNTKHKRILDVGCGFNPLGIIDRNDFDRYVGVDIDIEQQDFLKEVLKSNSKIEIKVGNAKDDFKSVDLVLALKLLPVLDQINQGDSVKFLENLKTKFLVVSFPNKSISGKNKGMLENYREKYLPIIESTNFVLVSERNFKGESIYIFKSKTGN